MGYVQDKAAVVSGRALPRVLVVDDEPAVAEFFRDALEARVGCKVYRAATLTEARDILNCEGIELLVTDVRLPDGDGTELLPLLRDRQPGATAMVITGAPSTDRAVAALRGGAVDFLSKPFDANQVVERVGRALTFQKLRARQEKKMDKLKAAVRKLSAARKQVSKKVDLLCNDLISAYGELSRQLEQVRVQESFRNCVEQSKGLEQLLCHAMDWLLRQVGYCNIGIWLTSAEQELQLGAFMKYTISAEPDLTESMQKNLLRVAMRRGFVRLRPAPVQGPVGAASAKVVNAIPATDSKGVLTPAEMKYLAQQDVIAINCTYLGETLGVMALFRDCKTPFSEEDAGAVKAVCPLFALALARAVKGVEATDVGEEPAAEAEPEADAGGPLIEPEDEGYKPKRKGKAKPKKDPADWWKTGEAPPF